MGWAAGRKLRRSLDGLTRVLAIEVLTAARGIAQRAPVEPGPASGAVIGLLRSEGWQGPGPDRFLAPEIELVRTAIVDGRLVTAVNGVLPEPLR